MKQHNGSTTTKVSPSSPMNRTTKVWFTFHYRYSFEAESGAFQQQSGAQPTMGLGAPERLSTTIRGTTHNGIGGSRTATSDHQGSQPPHGRLGSKDPRVTSSRISPPRILVEGSNRCKMQWQEHTKFLSPSLPNPTITTKAMEEYERKNKENTKNC